MATVALGAFASPAFAQEATVGTSAAANAVQETVPSEGPIDDIVVTATRRETSLQETPVTVTALSADNLAELGVTRVDQIATLVPNLYIAPGVANASTVSVGMRGRGDNSGGFGLSEQPVGFYFDDVYQGRPSSVNTEFSDIERVEVLRGPQGTLFGRNSMTGAVNVISRRPGDDTTGNLSASYGSYDTIRLRGAVSGPIVPGQLAASIAGVFTEMGEGYMDQIPTGGTTDRRNFWGLRGRLHYYGLDGFTATLTASHTNNTNDGIVYTPVDPVTLQPLPGTYQATFTPLDSIGETEVDAVSLHMTLELGDVTLRSITGYSETSDRWLVDLSGGYRRGPNDYVAAFQRDSRIAQNQFSQELQLLGDGFGGRLDWIVGLYYFTESVDQTMNDLTYSRSTNSFNTVPQIAYGATTRSYAAYAQLNFDITDQLELIAGGRFSYEEKSIAGNLNPTTTYADSTDFRAFTPRLGFSYKPNEDVMIYGSVSRGFRAGGYPSGATTLAQASTPFGPENVWAYELGIKTDLFDNMVRFNLTGYINDFSDLVISAFQPGTAVLVQGNGLSERVYGIEAELQIRPTRGLNIYGNLGLQNETDFSFIPGAQVSATLDRNIVVPYYTGMAGFRYETAIAGEWSLRFGGDFNLRDRVYSNINNLPVTLTSTIEEFNAEIALTSTSGWTFRVVGRNLTDREQWKNGIGIAFFNVSARQPVEPRTIFVEAAFAF